MRRDQLNRRIQQTSQAAKTERPSSPPVIQRGGAVRAGAGGGCLAYCKVDAPNDDEIPCYLKADLAAWNSATTYAMKNWVEVAGSEYRSLQDDNTNHAVSDDEWWEEGTVSVTVRCLIHNGDSLMYASPLLKDGAEILVHKVGGEWICPQFTGAKFGSFGV